MKKRLLVFSLAVALLVGSVPAVGAVSSTIVTKDEIVAAAREKLAISTEYKLEDVSFVERNEPEKKVWSIYFRQQDADGAGTVSVRMDAVSKEILDFNRYERKPDSENRALITGNEALALAKAVIKQFQPDKINQVKLSEQDLAKKQPGSTRLNFNFHRVINGYPFAADGFNITVDTTQKEVVSYRYQWTEELQQPELLTALTLNEEEAISQLGQIDKTRLIYIMARDKDYRELGLKLVYTSKLPGSGLIDAVTGELVPEEKIYRNGGYDRGYAADGKGEMANEQSAPLEKPKTVPDEGVISKEQAAAVAQETLTPLVDFDQMELAGASYRQQQNGAQKSWALYWNTPITEEKEKRTVNVQVTVDAVTSVVTNINLYSYQPGDNDDKNEGYSFEQLEQMAVQTLKQTFPEKVEQVQFVEEEQEVGLPRPMMELEKLRTGITAERLIKGIAYPANRLNFTFDADNGELTRFYYSWDDVEIPAATDALTLEKAEDAYYNAAGVRAQYVQLQQERKPLKDILLTYGVKEHQFRYIDALSGALLDQRGAEVPKENKARALTDISGHWAQRPIQLLFDQGIIESKDGKFNANKAITRQEAVKMAVLAKGYVGDQDTVTFKDVPKDHPYHKYIEAAVSMDLVEKNNGYFYPEKTMGRLDFIVLLIRFAGYDDVAKLKGIYQAPFKDHAAIATDKVGYAALANGLGIIKGENGYLRPQQDITRAETAVTLYRTIGFRR